MARNDYDSSREGALSTIEPLEFAIARREARRAEESWETRFASGRSVQGHSRADGGDRLVVRGSDGGIELEVTLTEEGPVLHFRAAEMTLATEGRMTLDCAELEVRSRGAIVQQCGGDLIQLADGDARISAGGGLDARGADTRIESTRGDVAVRANDDVRLLGERVKLNC